MTMVAAVNLLDACIVIADTRITKADGLFEPEYGLSKLIRIFKTTGDGIDGIAIIGFAGDVSTARNIIERLTSDLQRITQPVTMKEWGEQIPRIITNIINQGELIIERNVNLLYLGVDFDEYPISHMPDGTTRRLSSLLINHRFIYRISSTGVTVENQQSPVTVIGSGREYEADIKEQIISLLNAGRRMPNFQIIRSFLVGLFTSDIFSRSDFPTVGGPFEVLTIHRPNILHTNYVWTNEEGKDFNVSWTKHSDRIEVNNDDTHDVCYIMPLI